MTIKLKLDSWLYNAGVIGFLNILNSTDKNHTSNYINIARDLKRNHIEISEECLNDFATNYFKYFIHKYKNMTSWYQITSKSSLVQTITEENIDEKKFQEINKIIEYCKRILSSNSYRNTYSFLGEKGDALIGLSKDLHKIKMKKKDLFSDVWPAIANQIQVIKDICLNLEKDKKYILARNISYDVIQNFWTNVRFLHKESNKKDMYLEYHNYFVEPATEYNKLKNSDEYHKYKIQCFTCNNKMKSLKQSYTMTSLYKIGVDSSRKSSHFWNYNSDANICPVCNLIFSCVPAGFNFLKKRGIFVNQNSSIYKLLGINKMSLDNTKRFEDLENETYFRIVENLEQSYVNNFHKELENIQVVKLNANDGVTTPYKFNILSKEKLNILRINKKKLASLIGVYLKENKDYFNLYSEVLSRVYRNKNQYDLIYKLFYAYLKGDFNRIGYIYTILQINDSVNLERKTFSMVGINKIKQFQQYGIALRKKYGVDQQDNKLPSITYKLLNALKLKNETSFIHTLITTYMYKGMEVPLDFIEALKNKDVFQTIGYAFLLGLQTSNEKIEITEEKDNE